MSGPDLIGQGKLLPSEELWAARYEFLRQSGYLLRPRYRPGWVAPWTLRPGLYPIDFEDGIILTVSSALHRHRFLATDLFYLKRESLLDAQRLSDGKIVPQARRKDLP